uniref:Uncharacterized protein n=1 Tax=Pithovirus LCDPAC02 TaxID=2506601 RepID=A0A481YQ10_9VIRU|nr:MAG: hypothetical protein LCDPAC02_03480 [Pithovirus LCDPAC02]
MISKKLYDYIVSDILSAVVQSYINNIEVKSHIFKYLLNYFENLGIFEFEENEIINIVLDYEQNEELLELMNEIFPYDDVTGLLAHECYYVYSNTEDYGISGSFSPMNTWEDIIENADDSMSCIYWKYCSNLDLISQSVLIF